MLKLREELRSVKEGVDKTLAERESAAEKQVMAQMSREIDKLTREGDTYETIRATKSQGDVLELIHRTWKDTGEVLSETEACELIEKQLVEELLPLTKLGKISGKLPQSAPTLPDKHTKTLTNRDTGRAPTSRRERALQAFYGTK